MTIASMTGFARAEGHDGDLAWVWEVRSVNGRGLDLRCRTPAGWDALDLAARRAVQARFKRGNVSMTLTVVRTDRQAGVRVDRRVLDQLLALHGEMAALRLVDPAPLRLDMLLGTPGVIDRSGEDAVEDPQTRERRQGLVERSLEEALNRLDAARREEGTRLGAVLEGHLAQIAVLCGRVAAHPARHPDAVRARLVEQMSAVLNAVPQLAEDRLMQEAALIAGRADIREELDRLQAHVAQARDLLGDAGAIGRRLDFLSQEFNREANTLCSKSADVDLTRLGLELKAAIEQFREQVQNVE